MVDTDWGFTPSALNVWQLSRPSASLLLPEPGFPVLGTDGGVDAPAAFDWYGRVDVGIELADVSDGLDEQPATTSDVASNPARCLPLIIISFPLPCVLSGAVPPAHPGVGV